jgi:glucose-6-phosphate isomerase
MIPIRLDIGDGGKLIEQSVGSAALRALDAHLAAIHATFRSETELPLSTLETHLRAWTRSHLQDEHRRQVVALATQARQDFDALVTTGIGGSDLSARVFHDVLNHPYHNLLDATARGGAPEVYFTGDTFDPLRLNALLTMLRSRGLLSRTLFNVISKSGRTGETIATLMILRDAVASNASDAEGWRRQVVATTGLNDNSALYKLHAQNAFYGNTLLPVPDGVGGRFSAFSPVGTFFLATTAGREDAPNARVERLFRGVSEAASAFAEPPNADANVAFRLARWLHTAETYANKTTLVLYNYADNRPLGDWFVQLYSESIQERGGGLNVIPACGPTSNHSMLNGILEGPRDKVVVFLVWDDLGEDLTIPTGTPIGGEMDALEGLSMSQAQTASYRGTAEDFDANGVPTVTLHLPKRDERSLGCLLRVLMDTVAVKGRLQRLHVSDDDALDYANEKTYLQDGVEGYKERTRRFAAEMKRQR